MELQFEGLDKKQTAFVLRFFDLKHQQSVKNYQAEKQKLFGDFRLGEDKAMSAAVVKYIRHQNNEKFSMYITYVEAFYGIIAESSGPIGAKDDKDREQAMKLRADNHKSLEWYEEKISALKKALFPDPEDSVDEFIPADITPEAQAKSNGSTAKV